MALWDALAPAATVAQLVGTDAAGLVSATLQAVRTARRNRGECRALARRVMMVGDLLQLAQQGRSSSEAMRRPEVRRALDGLGGALRRAYELVESCQERGAVYGFVMAGRQAEQFRDVQAEIDAYLLVFPMAHIGDGLEVAIKKYPTHVLSVSSQYKSEFEVLKKLEHANIIKLLGHCTGEGEMILVYEYMPNGSLDKIIFDGRGDASLDWLTLFRIIEGIANGLLYLHTHELCIVHRDLKPSNILLDFDMNSKISDFGIAKMLCPGSSYDTGLSGTYGYMAPEYHRQGILSTKVDVYAYGVILLEAIAGKKSSVPCLQDDEYVNFIEHVWSLWSTGRTFELIDPPLRNNGAQITDISRCIEIALLCVQTDPADRPFMSDVVLMLSNKKTMPFPNRPDVYQSYPKPPNLYQSYSPKSEATWSSSDFTWPR
ncbi:unnamed protein product [Urochloa decumbens]|uniref:Protein kinase domain-containing protein n=1 Tax=Urochloa decumbens TaxID=240449 RepID=A0ABC9BQQ7_9POAL